MFLVIIQYVSTERTDHSILISLDFQYHAENVNMALIFSFGIYDNLNLKG